MTKIELSTNPDVHLRAQVWACQEDLRSSIGWAATTGLEQLPAVEKVSKAEIYDVMGEIYKEIADELMKKQH